MGPIINNPKVSEEVKVEDIIREQIIREEASHQYINKYVSKYLRGRIYG